jgi:superfamily I DNA/RNA helicase
VGCEEGLLPHYLPAAAATPSGGRADEEDQVAEGEAAGDFPTEEDRAAAEERVAEARRAAVAERVDEERRLFYVGMTRARQRLVLTHSDRRRLHGRVQQRRPSRFLSEIGADLRRMVDPQPLPRRRRGPAQLDLF